MSPLGASFAASPRTARATAPGKLILLGEHAVVFGEPALALPFGAVGATATVEPGAAGETPLITLRSDAYTGPLVGAASGESPEALALPPVAAGLGAAARCVLAALGLGPEEPALSGAPGAAVAQGGSVSSEATADTSCAVAEPGAKSQPHDPAPLALRLESTIPLARGLGSSAAVAVALARALYAAHGVCPTQAQLLEAVARAEACAHGNPSGVDAAAVCADGPVFFRKGAPLEVVRPGARMHLVVADSGERRDTRSAVAAVQARLAAAPEATRERLARLGALAEAGRAALEAGDSAGLGAQLSAAQAELAELGVSHPTLERLVTAALAAGALGAKLTGAGCGGCVVALAADEAGQEAVREAWAAAGAPATWAWTL